MTPTERTEARAQAEAVLAAGAEVNPRRLAELVLEALSDSEARYLAPRESLRQDHAALLHLLQSSGKRGEKLEALGLSGDEVHRIDMLSEWLRGLVEEMDERPGSNLTLDTEDRPMIPCAPGEPTAAEGCAQKQKQWTGRGRSTATAQAILDADFNSAGHILVRRDDVLCTRCLSVLPIHAGDGTPLSTLVVALRVLVKRHPATGNCTPHDDPED